MTPAGPRLRIVRLANFVTPVSGGLRTALRHLGEGYLAAGHEPVLIVPGPAYADETTSQGRVITLPGRTVPGTGGYRLLTSRARLEQLLREEFGRAGRAAVQGRTWQAVGDLLLDHYEQVLYARTAVAA